MILLNNKILFDVTGEVYEKKQDLSKLNVEVEREKRKKKIVSLQTALT